jgi:hypothetical protein
MSITPPKPGELITVTFVTSILDKLTELEGRLAALEKPSVRDSTISMTLGGISPATAYDSASNTLKVTTNGVLVGINATFTQPGTYDLTIVSVAPTANWNIILTQVTQTPFTIPSTEIPPGGQTGRTPSVFITPTPNTTPVSGMLEIHIKRQGTPNDQLVSFKLVSA